MVEQSFGQSAAKSKEMSTLQTETEELIQQLDDMSEETSSHAVKIMTQYLVSISEKEAKCKLQRINPFQSLRIY